MRRSFATQSRAPANFWLKWAVYVLTAAVIVIALCQAPAHATWKAEYASRSPEELDWYRNAELTPEARIRFPFSKCCDHSDVVKTRFTINKTDHGDEWYWLDGETWKRVPPDIIHWGESAPGGEPTLFVYSGKETCFFPGGENNL